MSGSEDPKKAPAKGFVASQSGKRTLLEIAGLLAGVALIVLLFRGCSGHLVTAITSAVPPSVDAQLGAAGASSFRAQYATAGAPDEEDVRRVEHLFEELLAALSSEERRILGEPRVTVVADPTVNAFALPGGEVFVLTGLLDRAGDDDDLVRGVLAHEIGHAVHRHGVRGLIKASLVSIALAYFFGADQELVSTLLAGASELDRLSHSREMEEEADRFGVDLLRRAGHDPSGLARFLESLESQPVPELLSTHPDPAERARVIREGE